MEVADQDLVEGSNQVVDPSVSKEKFQEELDIFLKREEAQRKRGIVLLKAEFPNMEFMFLAPHISPPPAAFTVRLNFENYDLEPPSIRLINTFTGELLRMNHALTFFPRKNPSNPLAPVVQLLQAETPTDIPFFCMPGVREYHNHPFHTGDSWLLHRKMGGEGTLGYLLDKLHDYGISSLNGFNFQIALTAPQVQLGIDLGKLIE